MGYGGSRWQNINIDNKNQNHFWLFLSKVLYYQSLDIIYHILYMNENLFSNKLTLKYRLKESRLFLYLQYTQIACNNNVAIDFWMTFVCKLACSHFSYISHFWPRIYRSFGKQAHVWMPYAFSSDVANDKFMISHFSSMQLDSLENFASRNNSRRSKIILNDKQLLKIT